MTLERGWGACLILVGALLIWAVLNPLADTNQMFTIWLLALVGGVGAIIGGLVLIVSGKPDAPKA